MISFLLITAFMVSIDSFVCGFSLSQFSQKKLRIVLIVCLTVLIMCNITNYFAVFLSKYVSESLADFGGIILILVGVYNLLKQQKQDTVDVNDKYSAFFIGFAVGLDGAIANLSLALMNINAFYVPIVIAVVHAIMVYFGILLSNTKLVLRLKKYYFIPYLILIFMGVYKLSGLIL